MKSNILREIFSGANGKLSAKRVIGGVGMISVIICTLVLAARDGSTEVVENLLTTILILSASLLGLPAITGVFGKSSITGYHQESSEETKSKKRKTE